MGDFFPDYRDPMFSIIVLFAIIFIISFANYWWGAFKSKEEKQSIKRFIKRFEIANDKETYSALLKDFKLSTESLGLLAYSYVKSGDFETAIEIYLVALKQVKTRAKKIYILSQLGYAYFKAGFLKRSAEIFLESLRISPRDRTALKYLTVCFEQLKEYDNALDTLDSLEELGVDAKQQKTFIKAKQILQDCTISDDKKTARLLELQKGFSLIQRLLVEYYQKNSIPVTKTMLANFNAKLLFDLLWFMDSDNLPVQGILFEDIARAKGLIKETKKSEIFELEILQELQKNGYQNANLTFEFTCKECKQTFPIHFYRCPNCYTLGSVAIQPILISKAHEEDTPFQ